MTNRDDALDSPRWFASSYSNDQGGQRVEAARMGTEPVRTMWVRDSKNQDGPVCAFGREPWITFIRVMADQAH
ncbi:DUF397 domain-containing protein [Streptomyces fulvoviolaceus]|uniref:DUF397 domain-containing protein n=1 Tax=Streptomyces fulvoviolaceus TaxID=285535 RepID=UPI0021C0504E|nr:DUF397 domain-containing protein [Streptomyces fulvoviolaceus]MCT9084109.1 DUF397 domain-containing protein [Streptomyces fulvoviolaceus]